MKKHLLSLFILFALSADAQHLYNIDLYDFLDELANAQVIDLNSAVKPYSREQVAVWLKTASGQQAALNNRQQQELALYSKEFVRELPAGQTRDAHLEWIGYYYKDSLFTFKASPVAGFSYWTNDSGSFYRQWGGAEAWGTVGRLSFAASLRDNHESSQLSNPSYLNQFPTSVYKKNNYDGGGDYEETRGHITYTWKWGSLGMAMDQVAWGDNYNGANILSGRAPVMPAIRFSMAPARWFAFNYVHAWLKSDVIDSVNIYSNGTSSRLVMRPKYMAANLFTFTPVRNLKLSVGNSIIYSDEHVNPAYLVPFLYYKAVDRTLNGYSNLGNQLGENSQLFFNVSSRNIKNTHLYASLFIDELSLGDMWEKNKQSNFISFKAGAHISNLFVENLFATAEFTVSRPVTYRHYITTADFATGSFNMGHYLGDNAREVFLAVGAKPVKGLWVEAGMTMAAKGEEYPYTGQSGTAGSGKGLPFLQETLWRTSDFRLRARYHVVYGAWLFADLSLTDHSGSKDQVYSQPYYRGKKTTINLGANIGF